MRQRGVFVHVRAHKGVYIYAYCVCVCGYIWIFCNSLQTHDSQEQVTWPSHVNNHNSYGKFKNKVLNFRNFRYYVSHVISFHIVHINFFFHIWCSHMMHLFACDFFKQFIFNIILSHDSFIFTCDLLMNYLFIYLYIWFFPT